MTIGETFEQVADEVSHLPLEDIRDPEIEAVIKKAMDEEPALREILRDIQNTEAEPQP